MDRVVLPDLNQLPFEADSFLGKALAAGRQYGQLPEYTGDVLMAYLRAQSLAFAQRYRTGIAIGRERLERGLKQAFICVELGLEERSGGDLNQAVALLAGGDLETLRQCGWEEALAGLAQMRTQARAWSRCPEALLLREHQDQLRQWRQLVPESWTSRDAEGREVWLDLRQERPRFQELEGRVLFLQSLPAASLEGLLRAAPGGRDFAEVLRQLVLVLALGLEHLVATPREVARFRQTCFTEGKVLPAVKDQVLGLFATHLENALPAGRENAALRRELAAQIDALEQVGLGAPEKFTGLFIVADRAAPPALPSVPPGQ
ncbi:MAG: hypothetical protein IT369_08755 [Candidatus Latescibacteria bacterium]|nr:hypothetical protein [Candidatus Latescibacterota bacterium]